MIAGVQQPVSGHDPLFTRAIGPVVAPFPARRSALFVDPSVSDADILAAGAACGTQIVWLAPAPPALMQIADFVEANGPFDALHIVAHGAPGVLAFSAGILTGSDLDRHALLRIGNALTDEAVISLYGCETGAGTKGRALVDRLAGATGAAVAASSAIVGAAARGGRWELDVRTGEREPRLFAAPSNLAAYPGTLAVNFTKGIDPLAQINGGSGEGRMVQGDFDNDGDVDILYQAGNLPGQGFGYFRGNGNGTFTQFTDANATGTPFDNFAFTGQQMFGLFVLDYDNDGDIDIVDRDNAGAGNTLGVWRNDGGSFTFVADPIGQINAGSGEGRMLQGDFDGDGDVDFLYQAGNTAGSGFGFVRNDGGGSFTKLGSLSGTPFEATDFLGQQMSTAGLFAVDYDNDGDVDIIDRDASGANTLGAWRNDGGAYVRVTDPLGTINNGAGESRMVFGDFDSDGDVDVLYQAGNTAGAGFGYFRNNGSGTFTNFTNAGTAGTPFQGFDFSGQQITSLLVVDYDHDGDVDILDRNPEGGLSVWVQGSDSGGDGSPPTLVSTTPADNATNVAPDANLTITFDEAVTKGTGNIEIVRLSDGVVVATIAVTSGQVTGSGTSWTINPPADLASLTGYGVRIEAGAFVDLDGAIFFGLDDETKFSFTTGVPNAPPTLANLNGDAATFTENGPAILLDVSSNATVSDGDSADFSGGVLTVSIVTNENAAEDVLGFNTSGAITLSSGMAVGSVVFVSGVAVGTISADGNGGDDLVVVLNANATPARTQALVRALTYSNADGLDPSTAGRGIQITLSDGDGGTSSVQTVTVNVTAVNDAPTVTMPAPIAVTEDVATAVTGIVFDDADAGGGSVTVTLSVPSGTLAATDFGGVTVGGTTTATLTLTGSISAINSFIAGARVTFTTAANATADVTLTASINDGGNSGGSGALTDTDTVTLDVTPVNDAPVVTTSGGTTAFTEGQDVTSTPVMVDAGLTLSDVDDTAFSQATVSISGGFVSGQDVLAFTGIPATMGNIELVSYNAGTGVLVLSSAGGTATRAQWEAALRAVTYSNSSETPNTANRTISFVVNDGAIDSLAGTKTVSVAAANDAPTVTMPAPIAVTEDVATAVTGIVFDDVDAGGGSVTVTLSVPSGTLAATTGGGVTVGGTGTASLTLTGSIAAINSFIAGSSVTFTTAANATADVTLTAAINDGGNSGGTARTDSGTVMLDVSAVNDAPVVTTTGGTTAFTEGQNVAATPVVIDSGLTLGDVDDTTFSQATVSISGGFVSGQDVLAFTGIPATMGNIELVSYNAGTGVLELSSAGGTATLAQWQAALRAITYTNSSDTPNTANRTVSFVVNDGTIDSLAGTKTVSVGAVNDAPVNSVPGAQATDEDTVLVFSTGHSNRISIADADAGGGSVSVTLTASNGLLTLSGTTGLTFSDGDGVNDAATTFTGTIAAINAVLNGLTFSPTPGYSGPASLQISTNDQGQSGGAAQSDMDTITITVTPQNDAPVLTLPATASFQENTVNTAPQLLAPSGVTVADAEGLAAGGRLAISGLLAEDSVSIRHQGTGIGQIGYDVASGAVSFGGVPFATAVTAAGSFTITFNAAVSIAAVAALIANLTYANSSNTPTASRTLSLLLNDGIENGAPAMITVGVTAQNDAPTDLTGGPFSIAELAANGTVVGTIGVVDADGPSPNVFSLLDNAGGRFAINSATGQVTVANGLLLDFEQARSHQISVQVRDGLGGLRQEAFTINLTDVANENALGGTGADSFVGGNADDKLVGYGGSDTLIGGAGNDTLFGGVGTDTMTGGTGDDHYYVDNVGDRVIELAGQGFDRIIATGVSYALPANVESLTIVGTGLTGRGSTGNDALYANGSGNTLIGLAGDDSYVVNASNTRIVETATGGSDLVRANGVSYSLANAANVERLELAGTGLTGTGTAAAETLVSKGTGNVLRGLGGNDTYAINAGDTVVEAAGGGIDRVFSSVTHTLGAHVENLILSGSGNLFGTGNALANVLTGNGGANRLSGLAGNDTLAGGLGADTLFGGAGNDVFDFNAIADSRTGAGNRDIIGDFTRGQDRIDLATIDANALLAGNQAFAFLGTASFTKAGQLRYVQEGSGATAKTVLWGNVDTGLGADFHIELKGHIALTAGDFVL